MWKEHLRKLSEQKNVERGFLVVLGGIVLVVLVPLLLSNAIMLILFVAVAVVLTTLFLIPGKPRSGAPRTHTGSRDRGEIAGTKPRSLGRASSRQLRPASKRLAHGPIRKRLPSQ